ncbi:MAG TPA: c-type cytochrome domain-containing protein, partial [Humisphaera sp.]
MLFRSTTAALLAAFLPAAALAADAKPIAVAKLDRSTPVDFEKEVLPVLNASCLACHNKTKPKAGLVLETPADIRKGGDSGPAAVAGKPEDSLLIKSAAHSAPD